MQREKTFFFPDKGNYFFRKALLLVANANQSLPENRQDPDSIKTKALP